MLSFTDSSYLLNSLLLRNLHENTLACDLILVARKRIGNVVCSFFSIVRVATTTDTTNALPSNEDDVYVRGKEVKKKDSESACKPSPGRYFEYCRKL